MGAQELAVVGLAGSGVGTALGLPMIRRRAPLDVRLFGAAVLSLSAVAALISARLAGVLPATPAVEHAINLCGLCGAPLVVLYARHAAGVSLNARESVWWWGPAAVYASIVASRAALGLPTRLAFEWLLPMILAFTVASVATLLTHRHRRPTLVVPAEWLVGFLVILNLAQIVRMQFGGAPAVRAIVPLVVSGGLLAVVAFVARRSVVAGPSLDARRPQASPPRYERSGLDESVAPELLGRIHRALDEERLFARADLTLPQLADAVRATPHQVSEALNRYAGVSFHELLNRRRVEDVKLQLLDPGSDRFTIEGIGASAGFGSRSALYAAFRRLEGVTPAAFRASHRQPPVV